MQVVVPWTLIGSAAVPGGGEIRLMQRGAEFSIMAGANELMNSRAGGSEELLARLSLQRVAAGSETCVLIGGLGMGFTLRAARAVRPDARIIVSEIVPEVLAWAHGPLKPVFGNGLADPALAVRIGDVGETIRANAAAFDAILLDVDNGPGGISRAGNDALYAMSGLRAAYQALRPGGVLAVWSSSPSSAFSERLRRSGFSVEEHKVRANGAGGGARHLIWLASRA